MFRTTGLAVLLLAALAVSAAAQKDKDKAKVYKTPQEVFDAFEAAEQKKDFKTWAGCLAPQAQKEMATFLAALPMNLRRALQKEKDAEKRAAVAKEFKPIFEVLDKHGLTEKATRDVKLSDKPREMQEDRKIILGLIKDVEAFLAEIAAAFNSTADEPKEKKEKAKLTAVKIDGDKATAVVVTKDKKGKEVKDPIKFVKVKQSWRIIPPMADGSDEPKEKKDEKTATPDFKTTAEALLMEFFKDEESAMKKYKNKVVEIEARVMLANKVKGPHGISLFGAKQKDKEIFVQCYEVKQIDKALALGEGQKVKAVGRVIDYTPRFFLSLGDVSLTALEPCPTTKVSAKQLLADFARDKDAALKKYLKDGKANKEIIVEGTVSELKQQKKGRDVECDLKLEGTTSAFVKCKVSEADFKTLKKGDKVAIKGFCPSLFPYDEDEKSVRIDDAFVLPGGATSSEEKTDKWTPSVELTSKAGKWLLKEAKTGTRMLADRTEYTLTVVPREMAGGTLVVRNSPEYGSWLPDGSVKANRDATVYAILRVKYAGKEVFGELAQALLVKDGWKEVDAAVATTEPRGEKWEWKAFKTTVKKGEIVLKLDNLTWRNNATGVLFVVK